MDVLIKYPETKKEFEKYYNFRWEMLRKPFGEPLGSEKDGKEDQSFHVMLVKLNKIIGVGRIHFFNTKKTAQVRYMAISKQYQNKGHGTLILNELELIAIKNNIINIILNSREDATQFYVKNGYKIIKKTHTLFNKIDHWLMEKEVIKQ